MSAGEETSLRRSETKPPARLLAIADDPSDDVELVSKVDTPRPI